MPEQHSEQYQNHAYMLSSEERFELREAFWRACLPDFLLDDLGIGAALGFDDIEISLVSVALDISRFGSMTCEITTRNAFITKSSVPASEKTFWIHL